MIDEIIEEFDNTLGVNRFKILQSSNVVGYDEYKTFLISKLKEYAKQKQIEVLENIKMNENFTRVSGTAGNCSLEERIVNKITSLKENNNVQQ